MTSTPDQPDLDLRARIKRAISEGECTDDDCDGYDCQTNAVLVVIERLTIGELTGQIERLRVGRDKALREVGTWAARSGKAKAEREHARAALARVRRVLNQADNGEVARSDFESGGICMARLIREALADPDSETGDDA